MIRTLQAPFVSVAALATGLTFVLAGVGVGSAGAAEQIGPTRSSPATTGPLTGTLVFIRDDNVWIARPDGTGARPLTRDGTTRWPYRSPSQDDAGHVIVIAGGPAHDRLFARMDQRGALLQRFAPPVSSLNILFAQVSPDGSKIAYGALFGDADCADFADCYTFFDHTVHYSAATRSSAPPGNGEASDVGWATWAGNSRTILETVVQYEVAYQTTTAHSSKTWFADCQNFDAGCNDEDHFQFEPTVDRAGDRYASSLMVRPWSTSIAPTAFLQVLATQHAVTADPPAAPGAGCAFPAPTPLADNPGHDQLTVMTPSFSPNGIAVAYGIHDGSSPDVVRVAVLPDLSDCANATASTVLTNASQPQWSPASLSSAVAPRLRYRGHRPRIKGAHRIGARLHLSKTGKQLRRSFTPDAAQVSYQWLRGGRPIRHAHRASYRLVRADHAHRISVRVTARLVGWRNGTVGTAKVRVR